MTKWLRRIRDVALMALTWAVAWAPIGVLLGLIVDPDGSMDEMWVAVGGYPGFLSGAVFSAVLGGTKGCRRFDEFPVSRVGALGAASGVLVGSLPFALLASNQTASPFGWLVGSLVFGSIVLLSAVSAAGSLALAKWWRHRSNSTCVTM